MSGIPVKISRGNCSQHLTKHQREEPQNKDKNIGLEMLGLLTRAGARVLLESGFELHSNCF